MPHRILIVDDEEVLCEELAEFFQSEGISGATAANAEQALEIAAEQDFDVVLTDIRMPGIDGVELVRRLRARAPETQILLMTAHPTVDTVIAALRLGAADYVTKPLSLADLLHKVRRMIEFRQHLQELHWYRRQLADAHEFGDIVGRSQAMQDVKRWIQRAAEHDSAVLITGESGTGKELVAWAIHQTGPRGHKRFVPVNCAAIPAALMESQLFGHLKGAFTGAETANEGLFAAASGGTLFLDEIGDLPLQLQSKLLRAIETREVLPIGATRSLAVDIRVISSTNKELQHAMAKGEFREDLFYRISTLDIHIPPLRERREDIPLLVEHFIRELRGRLRRKTTGVTNAAMRQLLRYKWKGNIRELKNVLERAMILEEDDLIAPAALPSSIVERSDAPKPTGPLHDAVKQFEREYIATILQAVDGNKQRAADLLGVSLSSLYRRLQESEGQAPAAD